MREKTEGIARERKEKKKDKEKEAKGGSSSWLVYVVVVIEANREQMTDKKWGLSL